MKEMYRPTVRSVYSKFEPMLEHYVNGTFKGIIEANDQRFYNRAIEAFVAAKNAADYFNRRHDNEIK
jgi:hypothetical protein